MDVAHRRAAKSSRRTSSVTATARVRMGDTICEEALCKARAFTPPAPGGRAPLQNARRAVPPLACGLAT
jgi:hypothetical protein